MLTRVPAQSPLACGTLPSGFAAISVAIFTNRSVSRLSPKSAAPSSLSAQFSIFVPRLSRLAILAFLFSPLSCQRTSDFLAILSRTFGLMGNDKSAKRYFAGLREIEHR